MFSASYPPTLMGHPQPTCPSSPSVHTFCTLRHLPVGPNSALEAASKVPVQVPVPQVTEASSEQRAQGLRSLSMMASSGIHSLSVSFAFAFKVLHKSLALSFTAGLGGGGSKGCALQRPCNCPSVPSEHLSSDLPPFTFAFTFVQELHAYSARIYLEGRTTPSTYDTKAQVAPPFQRRCKYDINTRPNHRQILCRALMDISDSPITNTNRQHTTPSASAEEVDGS